MAHRLERPKDPVEIEHDGERIVAERGESIAQALIAADRLLLARSPKLHRPRGPYCLRGACDGCLARVNGVPNVTTCLVPVVGGERIETQNVLGSRGVDMLRATDFLFPRGIDHHRLFAGMRGISSVVQKFARRVAGLGRLPSSAGNVLSAGRRDVEVLIVGAGQAGLAAAAALGARAPLVVDDALTPGGSLAALDPQKAKALVDAARAAGAELQMRTTAAALLHEPEDIQRGSFALIAGPDGASLIRARAVVLAPGAHDPALCFENDDLPGVLSARAALRLLRGGVVIGKRVAIVGSGRFASALADQRAFEAARVRAAELVRAVGRARVTAIVVRDGQKERRIAVDAVLIEGEPAPSFELAVQAGAEVRFDPARGFIPVPDADGLVARGVWYANRAAGTGGARVADAVLRALG